MTFPRSDLETGVLAYIAIGSWPVALLVAGIGLLWWGFGR